MQFFGLCKRTRNNFSLSMERDRVHVVSVCQKIRESNGNFHRRSTARRKRIRRNLIDAPARYRAARYATYCTNEVAPMRGAKVDAPTNSAQHRRSAKERGERGEEREGEKRRFIAVDLAVSTTCRYFSHEFALYTKMSTPTGKDSPRISLKCPTRHSRARLARSRIYNKPNSFVANSPAIPNRRGERKSTRRIFPTVFFLFLCR